MSGEKEKTVLGECGDTHIPVSPLHEYSYNTAVDDSQSLQSYITESDITLRPYVTFRERLTQYLYSTRYQIIVVALVVMDTLIVIIELLLDLEFKGSHSKAPDVLHGLSLTFLTVFLLEILLKLYVYRYQFFNKKGEVFDAIVVIVALVLDIMTVHHKDAFAGVGLIIVLRLWRVIRIQNSIVMSVRITGEKKLARERERRTVLEEEVLRYKEYCCKLERCYQVLKQTLDKHHIPLPSSAILPKFDPDRPEFMP